MRGHFRTRLVINLALGRASLRSAQDPAGVIPTRERLRSQQRSSVRRGAGGRLLAQLGQHRPDTALDQLGREPHKRSVRVRMRENSEAAGEGRESERERERERGGGHT